MEPQLVKNGIVAALTIAAILVVLRQCRKPTWWPGRLFLWIMNVRHRGVTNWGLSHVPIERRFTILDVGCGGGRTVQTLAALASEGKVYGIDYADESVATSRKTNAALIAEGRVDIRKASVSSLPFPDCTFDIVTAIETHYFWPDLAADLHEIRRVLKPGGRLVLIAESYRGRRFDTLYQPAMKLLRATYLSAGEHSNLLTAAGYSEVEVFEEHKKGWMCAVGTRPT